MALRPRSATVAIKKQQQIENVKAAETVAVVQALTPDSTLKKLANTQLELQATLGKVQGQFVGHFDELESIKKMIELKKTELKSLHDIEVGATTLATLNEQIEATRERWTQEAEERRQARDREEEQFQYDLAQKRKKDTDQYNLKLAAQTRQWEEREAALAAREAELKDLQAKVAGHDAVITAAEKKATATLENVLKKHYDHEAKLKDLQWAGDKRVLEGQVESLKAQVDRANADNAASQAQLKQALSDVKELTTRVTDAMAGRETITKLEKALEVMQPTRSGK
jgi:hypothetical protein